LTDVCVSLDAYGIGLNSSGGLWVRVLYPILSHAPNSGPFDLNDGDDVDELLGDADELSTGGERQKVVSLKSTGSNTICDGSEDSAPELTCPESFGLFVLELLPTAEAVNPIVSLSGSSTRGCDDGLSTSDGSDKALMEVVIAFKFCINALDARTALSTGCAAQTEGKVARVYWAAVELRVVTDGTKLSTWRLFIDTLDFEICGFGGAASDLLRIFRIAGTSLCVSNDLELGTTFTAALGFGDGSRFGDGWRSFNGVVWARTRAGYLALWMVVTTDVLASSLLVSLSVSVEDMLPVIRTFQSMVLAR